MTTESPASKFRSYLDDGDLDTEIKSRNKDFIPKSKRRLRFETNARIRRDRVMKDYVKMLMEQVNSSLSSLSCSESEKEEIMKRSIVFVEGDAEFRTSGPTFETQKMLFDHFENITVNGGDMYGRYVVRMGGYLTSNVLMACGSGSTRFKKCVETEKGIL